MPADGTDRNPKTNLAKLPVEKNKPVRNCKESVENLGEYKLKKQEQNKRIKMENINLKKYYFLVCRVLEEWGEPLDL